MYLDEDGSVAYFLAGIAAVTGVFAVIAVALFVAWRVELTDGASAHNVPACQYIATPVHDGSAK